MINTMMQPSSDQLQMVMGQMVEALKLSEDKQKMIRLRYGLDGKGSVTFKEMIKILNIKPKQLKKEIEEVDRLVFNYLKNRV